MLDGFDAVFFDAGMTLLMPTVPVADAYLSGARRIGVEIDRDRFVARHAEAWKDLNDRYRSAHADLSTSDELERRAWFEFTRDVAGSFPELLPRHAAWLSELEAWFDSPAAWRPAEGAKRIVRTLRRRGVVCGVLSNWHTALHGILRGLDLHGEFDFVLTSAEAGKKKPHREIFAQAVARAGRPADRIAHVGDSWNDDVHGARNAGLTPIYLGPEGVAAADPGVRRAERFRDLMAGTEA